MKPDESRVVYDGKLFDVTIERWGDHEREIVEHLGAVAIVAVDRGGMVNLVRQRREAARKELVELPAGTLEAGETPRGSALRELEEETGLRGRTVAAGDVGRRLGEVEDAKTLVGPLLYLREGRVRRP